MATVKTQAHCLLAGAAAAAVCAWPWAQSSLAADFVHHTALAATIGGLADWWGVTALFKRPMGINAPGTDVLRNNYERLTTGLADFVSNDLLTAENVMQAVGRENFAKLLLTKILPSCCWRILRSSRMWSACGKRCGRWRSMRCNHSIPGRLNSCFCKSCLNILPACVFRRFWWTHCRRL